VRKVTALTSTNHHFTVLLHHVCTKCKIKQHLGVNFGDICRFEHRFFIWFFGVFMLKKFGLIFKSPVTTVSRTRHLGSFIMSMTSSVFTLSCYICKVPFLSVLIRIHVIHPNNTNSSVNEHWFAMITMEYQITIWYSIVIIAMQIQHSSQFMKARQPRQVGLVVYLMQNLRLRGRSPPIIFARIVRPMNDLQLCRWQFTHKETL